MLSFVHLHESDLEYYQPTTVKSAILAAFRSVMFPLLGLSMHMHQPIHDCGTYIIHTYIHAYQLEKDGME